MNDREIIVNALRETADEYAEKNNQSSGAEGMIYGEICDALRSLAEKIETQT